jgi:hypothetical protein
LYVRIGQLEYRYENVFFFICRNSIAMFVCGYVREMHGKLSEKVMEWKICLPYISFEEKQTES